MNCLRLLGAVAVASFALSAGAMPSRNDLKKVQPTVNELMADDMKAVKSGKMKQTEAADHAVGYAREATDEASKFLFYKGAFGLYVKGRAYSEALKALDLLKAEVKDVPDKVLLEIIGGKMKDVPREDGGALVALYESLNRKLRCEDECKRLEGALKSNPKNAEARRQLAVCRAQLGDWTAATTAFAQLEGAEGKAAKQEQAGELKAAADGWWDLAANAEEDDQTLFRRHAADLYRKAIDAGKVTGIQKSLAQKRADDYPAEGAKVATTTSPLPAEGKTASSGGGGAVAEKSAPRAVVMPVAKGTYKTHFPVIRSPKDLELPKSFKSGQKFVDLDLGGSCEAMSFAAIAPGQVEVWIRDRAGKGWEGVPESVKISVSRPFWLSQFPVTFVQAKQAGFFDDDVDPSAKAKIEKILSAVGGDENVLVPSFFFSGEKAKVFYEYLNRSYGKLLPRGMVFRAPTFAEMSVASSIAVRPQLPQIKDVVSYLKPKGLFADFNPTRGDYQQYINYCYKNLCGQFIPILGPDNWRTSRSICGFDKNIGEDRVVVPELAMVKQMYLSREQTGMCLEALHLQKVMKDPFWYSEAEGDACRFHVGGGGLMGWQNGWRAPVFTLRVVIGPDYVSEWKARSGR